MNEQEILDQIRTLVDQEHDLRTRSVAGEIDSAEEQARLRSLEESLDQCWDLLRQRRARREVGDNPDNAEVRPAQQVEGYLQ
ncbi:DUF2630 domain-containing protein [Kibdelosporangium persicum]|uniref:Sensor-type histidine kinase prrB n=1 Tax=Kibdelosporangium persicum TaxID=2698649 RepID=A0ABX2FAZ4_9PSEU|nr:DUF2630 family protein [Kibdelosporangium persicum]NRN68071.1 Sensor-type histidine kinase prrB [Kibdelosporangium persicum]